MSWGARLGLLALPLLAVGAWWLARPTSEQVLGIITTDSGAVLVTRRRGSPDAVLRSASTAPAWATELDGPIFSGPGFGSVERSGALITLVESADGPVAATVDLGTGALRAVKGLPAEDSAFAGPQRVDESIRILTRTPEGGGVAQWTPGQSALDWHTPLPTRRATALMTRGSTSLVFNQRWWAFDALGRAFGFDARFTQGTCFVGREAIGLTDAGLLRQRIGGAAQRVSSTAKMHSWTCGRRGSDLVFFGGPSTHVRATRLDPETGAVHWDQRLPGVQLSRPVVGADALDARWHPLRGAMLGVVPVHLVAADSASRWVLFDVDSGQARWTSPRLTGDEVAGDYAVRNSSGVHVMVRASGTHLISLDGADGSILAAVRAKLSAVRAANMAGAPVWAAAPDEAPPDQLPWIALAPRTLAVERRGHPTLPVVRDALSETRTLFGRGP